MKKISIIALGLFIAGSVIGACHFLTPKEGTTFLLEVTPDPDSKTGVKNKEELLNKCCQILRQRCEYSGLTVVDIQPIADQPNRIRLGLQGSHDTERMKRLLTSSSKLGFWEMYLSHEVQSYITAANEKLRTLLKDSNKDKEEIYREYPLLSLLQVTTNTSYPISPIGYTVATDTAIVNKYLNLPEIKAIFPPDLRLIWGTDSHDQKVCVLHALKVTEKNGRAPLEEDIITNAKSENDNYGKACLSIVMNEDGTQRWAQMTKKNIGRTIAILLNNQLYAAPQVNAEITGGHLQVSGDFTETEVQDIACMLTSGSLPASIKIVQTTVHTDK